MKNFPGKKVFFWKSFHQTKQEKTEIIHFEYDFFVLFLETFQKNKFPKNFFSVDLIKFSKKKRNLIETRVSFIHSSHIPIYRNVFNYFVFGQPTNQAANQFFFLQKKDDCKKDRLIQHQHITPLFSHKNFVNKIRLAAYAFVCLRAM